VERHPAGCGPELRLEIASPLPPLPSRTVHHLRMIAQEAVTNALKHAAARAIRLGLEVNDNQLIMTVTDDGCGFDVSAQRAPKAGHFGCIGIEERCDKLGAEVRWLSAPGKGTAVEVVLPLPGTLAVVNGNALSNV
jgi:signal transduction histidine kinase